MPNEDRSNKASLIQKSINQSKKIFQETLRAKNVHLYKLPIVLMNKGMLIGDEDALAMSNYTKTVVCRTMKAEVLEIQAINFLKIMKLCQEAPNIIYDKESRRLQDHTLQFRAMNQGMKDLTKKKEKTKREGMVLPLTMPRAIVPVPASKNVQLKPQTNTKKAFTQPQTTN